MSKCTVYLVVFAEDLNVEIDTHVIRNYGLDGWDGLVEDSKLKRGSPRTGPSSRKPAVLPRRHDLTLYSRRSTLYFIPCITTPLVLRSIKDAWIYICVYAYSTESCIHSFRNQPASVQRQSPDKENQRFPLVFAGLFSWRGGGGDYSTRVERVDGCD